jgi:putative ABC transport system substrate-binding protein
MDRRAFLGNLVGGLLAAPLAARAQPTGRVYRIGMLETISIALNAAHLDAFRQGLRELGYVEGQNVVIEYRSADGRQERFPELAMELVRLKVDLIVTTGTPAALAAKNAAGTIPVVIAGVGDPVGSGIVGSLARPGGNVTGLSAFNVEIYAKRVELLRELVPRLAGIAGLFNMSNPVLPLQWNEVERAARALGIQPQLLDVRKPEDLGRAFDAATRQRADALVVALDALTQATKHRLPAIYGSAEFVHAGGLITYSANRPHLYYRSATYVDKILKGAKAGDLPMEQPTKFELVVNLKTAETLGLTVPQSLLHRADQVIE